MTYRRIASWSDLPASGPKEARETYELDFKSAEADGTFKCDASEMAKDMGAFANTYGGVIIAGISEYATSYEHAKLLLSEAPKVARSYEDAARDLLAPRPLVDPTIVPATNGKHAIVAVNVDPYPDQLVGARLSNTEAWRFPIRTASRHTKCIDPEAAMLYANPKARKNAILLARIAEGVLVEVQVRAQRTNDQPKTVGVDARVGEVDPYTNAFRVTVSHGTALNMRGDGPDIKVPLDDVDTVWLDEATESSRAYRRWRVTLRGTLRQIDGAPGLVYRYFASDVAR